MSDWSDWIGREQTASDHLDESLAQRWLATFDLPAPKNPIMPQGIHFALCTPDTATASLGEDGHPLRDDSENSFLPPIPMPRRMWASSAIQFLCPISKGWPITRRSTIGAITEKHGKSGKLTFVQVDHSTYSETIHCVRETQTLVYREAGSPDAPLSPPELGSDRFDPSEWDAHHSLTPDPRLLFRYSALTFNTHRIHYDAPYARDVERYRGLVVHGPLTASLLLQLAADEFGDNALKTFAFQGMSPAIADEPLHLVLRKTGNAIEMGAFAGDGRQVTKAKASL